MRVFQEQAGYYWCTQDAAQLRFDSDFDTHGAEPTEIVCHRIGHVCLVLPDKVTVPLESLTLIAVAEFGAARGKNGSKWTGDAYRFGIYAAKPTFGRDRVVIIRTDGGGSYFYYIDELDVAETWNQLALALPTEMLWNLCSTLCHTYEEGRKHGRKIALTQFLEGKLKKRKKQGRFYVESVA